ncbi:MAG: radical SAM protein, partial [Clostridiales bacterium]|nr:radical SAM protein [Clostridiales bacterium]
MLIVVYTLGCKINRIESRSVIAELTALGHETTEDFVPADLYVINTCAVTAEAERKSRQMVSKAARVSPGAKVIILGCSGQNDREAFGRFDNVVFIGGAASKARAVREYIDGAGGASGRFALPEVYEEMRLPARTKTREFVKVQDGCDNFCSYCIVPYLRGSSRSRGLDSIAAELNAVEAKEIVLSGVNLSDYGSNIGAGLTDLLRTAGAATSARIRLGSLEARVITDGLLQTMSEINFCRHFHLSLQSGSAEVLRAMNRKYT